LNGRFVINESYFTPKTNSLNSCPASSLFYPTYEF
jgi:hypothetical protein